MGMDLARKIKGEILASRAAAQHRKTEKNIDLTLSTVKKVNIVACLVVASKPSPLLLDPDRTVAVRVRRCRLRSTSNDKSLTLCDSEQ